MARNHGEPMRQPYDDSDLNSPAHEMPKREMTRDSLFLQAQLRFVGGEDCGEVRVRNLSAGGMMAQAPVIAKRGDRVEVELRHIGRVTGYVAWVAKQRFGVAFDHEIDPKLARKPVGQSKLELPRHLKAQAAPRRAAKSRPR